MMSKCKQNFDQLQFDGFFSEIGLLLKETNLKFAKVYQLVDSSTVLGYVNKECGNFHPYEGIRVAEAQSSGEFVDGRLLNFA